jgi:glycerol-3-phosphate dehydrogenase subunit C
VTTTYDPRDPAYHDLGDLRGELGRVFDLCHGCRLCLSLCPSFPTMFDAIDARDGAVDEMTPAEQDRVVDECYQCKLCYVKCPYVPPHEWQLDFPRLMLRAVSARREHEGGLAGLRERVTTEVLGRTDLLGRVASVAAPLAKKKENLLVKNIKREGES